MPELAYMITCISHTGSVITKIKQVPNLFYSGSQRMMKLFLKKNEDVWDCSENKGFFKTN